MAEHCLVFHSWLKCMNNMHLKVHELSIDRMLRWCMEVILKSMQIAGVNSLLEQGDSGCPHEVVQWWFWTFQNDLDLLTFLVEFNLWSWINYIVFELKVVVLKLLCDRDGRVEVDWRLQDTITDNTLLLLLKQVVVGSHPVVLNKLTWSSVESILEVFAVVVVEVAFLQSTGSSSATWHATNNWNAFTFAFAHDDVLLTKIWLIQAQCAFSWLATRVEG